MVGEDNMISFNTGGSVRYQVPVLTASGSTVSKNNTVSIAAHKTVISWSVSE